VRNCHELSKCQTAKDNIVCCIEVGYLEVKVFSREVFLSPEGHRKSDLSDWGHCCARDYDVKRGPTGVQR
jgi:hypothetical protein